MMSCGAKWPKSKGLNGLLKIAGRTVQNIKFAVGLSLSVASRSVLSVGSKVYIGRPGFNARSAQTRSHEACTDGTGTRKY